MPYPDLVLNIRKPIGWTSFDVVRLVKRIMPGERVGHAGTLDPFAAGVLLICTGKETKNILQLVCAEKEYHARIRLGYETDTLDISGAVTRTEKVPVITMEDLQKTAHLFCGEMEQTPPRFSALKIHGKRWFELARAGSEATPKPRLVKIEKIDIIRFSADTVTLQVVCGKGTYIRSLARDFAQQLGTVGYLSALQRTRIGRYTSASSSEVTDIYKTIGKLKENIIS